MNFVDLYDKELASLLEENNIDKIFTYIYENKLPVIELGGFSRYYVLYENDDYHLLGFSKVFKNLKECANYINNTFDECVDLTDDIIKEDLARAKFKYTNYKHDPKPKTIVLDADYIYNGKGKVIPGQHDILAFNINYAKDKKFTRKAIQEIVTFAHMIKKDKKDVYQRLKDLYPECTKYIRHYKPEYMKGIKMKKGWMWKSASIADIQDYNRAQQNEWK